MNTCRRCGILLAVLLGPGLFMIGCGGGGGGGAPSTARVQGEVRDVDGDVPLEGVTVTVGGVSGTTDSTGQYAIDNVPVGAQSLSVHKDDYEVVGSLPSPVAVTAPTTVLTTIYMERATARVEGEVRDIDGDVPVEGVTVTVGGRNGTTDSTGQYVIENVPVGDQSLSVHKDNYQVVGSLPSPVAVTAPTTVLDTIYMEEIPPLRV